MTYGKPSVTAIWSSMAVIIVEGYRGEMEVGNQADTNRMGKSTFASHRPPSFTAPTERKRSKSYPRRISAPDSMSITGKRLRSTIRNS